MSNLVGYRGKRLFDLAVALVAAPIAVPLAAVSGLLIRLTVGSPVLFTQERPGALERPFTLYKFRTMSDARDLHGELLPDGERLTRVGRLLRKTSLDELPELVNVVRGDMSIVGPRPLLSRYLPFFTEREKMRHTVRPGITGLAQVSGRNFLNWDERLEHDVVYVERMSLWLDLQILAKTIAVVLSGSGVSTDPDAAETYLDEERSEGSGR